MVENRQIQAAKYFSTISDILKEQGPKMALNACDKYLKKMPVHPLLQSIKAYLLVQLGKDQAGIDLAKEICSAKPTDTDVLMQIEKVYISVNDCTTCILYDNSAVDMFQDAFDRVQSEELGVLLFMAVLRTEDLKRLFSVALNLKTTFKNPRYIFWAALALLLQSNQGEDAENSSVAKELKLAQHMLMKEHAISSFNSIEELNLFLLVASSNKDFATAQKIFADIEGRISNEYEISSVKADLLLKSESWEAAFDYGAKLLQANGLHDWSIWKCFCTAFSKLDKDGRREETLGEILKGNPEKKVSDERTLFLARIDASLSGYQYEGLSTVQLMLEYAKSVPSRPSRIPDILFMFNRMSTEQKNEFRKAVDAECSQDPAELVFWCQLKRIVKSKLGLWSIDEIVASKNAILNMPKVEDDSVKNSDLLAAENSILALLEVDMWLKTEKRTLSHLIQAIHHLCTALEASPGDFLIRTLLTIVYLSAGCIFSALETFRHLDIKQIQIDSLSYLIADHLLNLGDVNDAEVFFHESFFLYDDNRTQTLTVIAESCLKESYSKIPEFYSLFTRLEHSIQSVACIVETIRTELLFKPVSHLVEYVNGMKSEELLFTEEIVDKIVDNRDTDIIDFIDPACAVKDGLHSGLPKFERSSIWALTCLTLLLKCLVNGDAELITKLTSEYRQPVYFKCDEGHQQSKAGSAFALGLLDCFSGLCLNTPDAVQKLTDWLASAFEANLVLPTAITGYADLFCFQSAIEHLRWATLCTAMYIEGQKPKARRSALRSAQPALDCLEDEYKRILAALDSIDLDGPVECGNEEVYKMVLANWKQSMNFFKAVLELTNLIVTDMKLPKAN